MLSESLSINALPPLAPSLIAYASRLLSVVVDDGVGLDGIREGLYNVFLQWTIPGPVPTPALSVADRLLLVDPALAGSLGKWWVLGGGIGFEEGATESELRLLDSNADVLRFVRGVVFRSGAMSTTLAS